MRVLVVHNRYSSRAPSGENLAVRDEVGWLREAGVDVALHEVSNDDVIQAGPRQRAAQAVESVWSLSAKRQLADAWREARPDLVHVHNLFPLLTASVPWAALQRGIPVVWTVHNSRPICVIGTNFRAGQPCHVCRPGWRVPGIRHGCYGGSVVASALVTGATAVFRPLARRRLTAIAISQSVQRWLTGPAGFPAGRTRVKYDGVAGPAATAEVPPPASRQAFLFAGYLTDYKGVPLLLDAWRRADLPAPAELRIVGDGPLLPEVKRAAARDPRITWTGNVAAAQMPAHLSDARAVVLPSVWEEPFGRTAAEALAYGRPVITSGTGGLREIVDAGSGWVTGPSADALAEAMRHAARSDEAVTQRGQAAAQRHLRLFSPAATTRQLVRIYDDVLGG